MKRVSRSLAPPIYEVVLHALDRLRTASSGSKGVTREVIYERVHAPDLKDEVLGRAISRNNVASALCYLVKLNLAAGFGKSRERRFLRTDVEYVKAPPPQPKRPTSDQQFSPILSAWLSGRVWRPSRPKRRGKRSVEATA